MELVDLKMITPEVLKKLGLDYGTIYWFEKNIGELPIESLGMIDGDYNGYISTIMERTLGINDYLFGKEDRVIAMTTIGNRYVYDEKGNLIRFEYPCYPNIIEYKYDDKGRLIKTIPGHHWIQWCPNIVMMIKIDPYNYLVRDTTYVDNLINCTTNGTLLWQRKTEIIDNVSYQYLNDKLEVKIPLI